MPAQYPLPVFHFSVQWGGTRIGFSEVTGLTQENQAIEYRDGSFPEYSSIKMPGLRKFSNVTLKRGIIGDTALFSWLRATAQGSSDVRNIAIILLDETHVPVMRWLLSRAWPSKWEAGALKATANEIAIETLTLICERIEID